MVYSDSYRIASSAFVAFSSCGDHLQCFYFVGCHVARSTALFYKHNGMEDLKRILVDLEGELKENEERWRGYQNNNSFWRSSLLYRFTMQHQWASPAVIWFQYAIVFGWVYFHWSSWGKSERIERNRECGYKEVEIEIWSLDNVLPVSEDSWWE